MQPVHRPSSRTAETTQKAAFIPAQGVACNRRRANARRPASLRTRATSTALPRNAGSSSNPGSASIARIRASRRISPCNRARRRWPGGSASSRARSSTARAPSMASSTSSICRTMRRSRHWMMEGRGDMAAFFCAVEVPYMFSHAPPKRKRFFLIRQRNLSNALAPTSHPLARACRYQASAVDCSPTARPNLGVKPGDGGCPGVPRDLRFT